MSRGPFVLGSGRSAELAACVLRAHGYRAAVASVELPRRGMVFVPAEAAARDTVEGWADGAERLAVVEPDRGESVPLSGVPRELGLRRLSPSRAPLEGEELDALYLSEVAAVALTGYKARLDHDRPFPADWRAVAARAIDELAAKADDPQALGALRSQLGEPAALEPPTDAEWETLIATLDLRRGMFRRGGVDRLAWELHPRVLWALACRTGRFVLTATNPASYGVEARGTASGPWVDDAGGGVFRLRASVLSAAAAEIDPPDLPYQYDFSDNAPPPPLDQALAELPDELAPRGDVPALTVCVRHDVDRPLSDDDLAGHLRLEDELDLRSTWFFKRETFDPVVAERLREGGREVAYHAEILSTGDDGFADELHEWAGAPVGLSFHGGLGSEGWRGRRSFVEAAALGAAYAELQVGVRPRPELWPIPGGGELPLAPMPLKPDVFPERVEAQLEALASVEPAMVIVENHPDRCDEGYRSLLRSLADRGALPRTVGEALAAALPGAATRS